uniref:Uncharacterized protein n=1 Tax=Rhizophora mucronata TaxID=61149 RepID=A0A2P2Q2Y6_RHIMU
MCLNVRSFKNHIWIVVRLCSCCKKDDVNYLFRQYEL